MPNLGAIAGETADLFDAVTGIWIGVVNKAGQEQLVPQGNTPMLLFVLRNADLQAVTDQAFTKAMQFTTYHIDKVVAKRVTGGATVACAGGIYTATAKGGSALVAAAQSWLGVSGAGKMVLATKAAVADTDTQTATPLYLSLTTGSTAAVTADLFIYGTPID